MSLLNSSLYCQAYTRFESVKADVYFWMAVFRILAVFFGLFGYILQLLVLSNHQFNGASFLYHKAVAILEIANMFTLPLYALQGLGSERFSITSYLADIMYVTLSNSLTLMVHFLILGMTIDRFVAIWIPRKFPKVNRPNFVYGFCFLAFLNGLGPFTYLLAYQIVFDSNCGCFSRSNTPLYNRIYVPLYSTFMLIEIVKSLVNLSLTVGICVGLIRKTSLVSHLGVDNAQLSQEKSANRQLAALCLSCSIPFLITVFIKMSESFRPAYIVGYGAENLTVQEGLKNIGYGYFDVYFTIPHDMVYLFTHCAHFYVYLLLSSRFRSGAKLIFSKVRKYQNNQSTTSLFHTPLSTALRTLSTME